MDLGAACAAYQDRVLWNLDSRRIQCDEIWSFCYAKAMYYNFAGPHQSVGKRTTPAMAAGVADHV